MIGSSAPGMGKGGFPQDGQLLRDIAEAGVMVERIRVRHAIQCDAVDGMMQTLHGAVCKAPGEACGVVTLIAPRGVGKSAAIALVEAEAQRLYPDRVSPVLKVQMSSSGTIESIPTKILGALGDPRPDLGRPDLRWLKAVKGVKESGVRLIMLDEFNRAARRPTLSGPIGQAICENIMEPGIASVVLVGEEDASVVLKRAPLLFERVDEELDLSPLDWLRPGDDAIWTEFVKAFDEEMLRLGLVAVPAGFGNPETARRLCIASDGLIRRFVKMVKLALADAMRRGDRAITANDLRNAVQAFAIARGHLVQNPFEGLAA